MDFSEKLKQIRKSEGKPFDILTILLAIFHKSGGEIDI